MNLYNDVCWFLSAIRWNNDLLSLLDTRDFNNYRLYVNNKIKGEVCSERLWYNGQEWDSMTHEQQRTEDEIKRERRKGSSSYCKEYYIFIIIIIIYFSLCLFGYRGKTQAFSKVEPTDSSKSCQRQTTYSTFHWTMLTKLHWFHFKPFVYIYYL